MGPGSPTQQSDAVSAQQMLSCQQIDGFPNAPQLPSNDDGAGQLPAIGPRTQPAATAAARSATVATTRIIIGVAPFINMTAHIWRGRRLNFKVTGRQQQRWQGRIFPPQ